jgi:hypothetical protein
VLALDAEEIVGQRVDERGLDRVLDDGEAVALDALQMLREECRVDEGGPPESRE